MSPEPVLRLSGVSLRRDGRTLLAPLDWEVGADERWVVLGRNGSGKSTLLRIASLQLHPSTGTVEVLGERLGRTDVRSLRARIGVSSAALAAQLRPDLSAGDVVMTGRFGALEPWWHSYTDEDRSRADALLERLGVGSFARQPWGLLSSGERQRVLLARSLMPEPALLVLDEPTAGLDLPGREDLVDSLALLAADPDLPPVLLVTHHVEEIPPGFSHVVLLRGGEVVGRGPLDAALDGASLSRCMGLDLVVERHGGRFSARRA